jgi:hypothetical protein
MQLIYAMGEPKRMSFAVATTPTALPPGALVYAICDGTSMVERVDDDTYEAMSDIEYLTFKQVVDDARRHELRRTSSETPKAGAFRRLRQWFTGADAQGRRRESWAFRDLIGSN